MTETLSSNQNNVANGSQSNPIGVPLAIVIAGGLIALAIYFGGSRGPTANTALAPTALPEVAAPAEPTIGAIRPVSDTDHIRGAANAKITLIEYSDLECPYCKQFHPTLLQVVADYPNDVRWVYRHAPIKQLHSKAPLEAEATECAGEQGKFWELTDMIYKVTPANNGLDVATLPQLAATAGVADIKRFTACLTDGTYTARVADDFADAQNAGMRGTPYAVVMNDQGDTLPISGAVPYETVKATIEQLLNS